MAEGDAALVVAVLTIFLTGFCFGRLRASAPPVGSGVRASSCVQSPDIPASADAAPAVGARFAPPPAAAGPESPPDALGPRSVSVQSPVTFKRWLAQPRFQPLPPDGHGCWPE